MIPLFKVMMTEEAVEAAAKVLRSGYVGQGEMVERFEVAFADLIDSKQPVVATNSCTSAIEMVLTYLGVGHGDEVITSPLTCVATNAPIVHLGARPVWADVDENGLIVYESVQKKLSPRTKAIIGVNWTGRPMDWTKYMSLGVPLIEDAAHGPLVSRMGPPPDYTCYSFGPIKHLTCGDGGAVIPRDPWKAEPLRLLRWYGLDRKSSKDFRCEQDIVRLGMKWHMNDINAAIGLANLPALYENVQQHRKNAGLLWNKLNQYRGDHFLLPDFDPLSNYWVFPIRVFDKSSPGRWSSYRGQQRDRLRTYLVEHGVQASQVHARNDKHSAFKGASDGLMLHGTDSFDQTQLNLPCGWWMAQEEVDIIVHALKTFFGWTR